jgi:hypothetical protein
MAGIIKNFAGLLVIFFIFISPLEAQVQHKMDGDPYSDIVLYTTAPVAGDNSLVAVVRKSSNLSVSILPIGEPGDIPVPYDYTGDGLTNLASFNPSTGHWKINKGGKITNSFWGAPGTKPVPGYYEKSKVKGGCVNLATFDTRTSLWYIQSCDQTRILKNVKLGDPKKNPIPVPGDYDGDGVTDLAVFHKADMSWEIIQSKNKNNKITKFHYGLWGDLPVPADYNGNRKIEAAVWRPTTGHWFLKEQNKIVQWGLPGDKPFAADFDGDKKFDFAVYRPSDNTVYILTQSGATFTVPLPAKEQLASLPTFAKDVTPLTDINFSSSRVGGVNSLLTTLCVQPISNPLAQLTADLEAEIFSLLSYIQHVKNQLSNIKKPSVDMTLECLIDLGFQFECSVDLSAYSELVSKLDVNAVAQCLGNFGINSAIDFSAIGQCDFDYNFTSLDSIKSCMLNSLPRLPQFNRPQDLFAHLTARLNSILSLTAHLQHFQAHILSVQNYCAIIRPCIVTGTNLSSCLPRPVESFREFMCKGTIPDLSGITAYFDSELTMLMQIVDNFLKSLLGIKIPGVGDISQCLPSFDANFDCFANANLSSLLNINIPNFSQCLASITNRLNLFADFDLSKLARCSADFRGLDLNNIGNCRLDIDINAGLPQIRPPDLTNVSFNLLASLQGILDVVTSLKEISNLLKLSTQICKFPAEEAGMIEAAKLSPALSPAPIIQHRIARVPGDYTGDGLSNLVVYRQAPNAKTEWRIHRADNTIASIVHGRHEDTPMPGDYSGNGITQPTVVRNQGGYLYWDTLLPNGQVETIQWGLQGDQVLSGDLDCDGKSERIVVRYGHDGFLRWFALLSTGKIDPELSIHGKLYGINGDTVYVADMNGDGCDDLIATRDIGIQKYWFWHDLQTGYQSNPIPFGLYGDQTVAPFDTDGNGNADIMVVRSIGGYYYWFLRTNLAPDVMFQYGMDGDKLSPGFYSGTGFGEFTIYRPGLGSHPGNLWIRTYYGTSMVKPLYGGNRIINPSGQLR